jgi:hypothetical protein
MNANRSSREARSSSRASGEDTASPEAPPPSRFDRSYECDDATHPHVDPQSPAEFAENLEWWELRCDFLRAQLTAIKAENRQRRRSRRAPWLTEWRDAFYARNPVRLAAATLVLPIALAHIEFTERATRLLSDIACDGYGVATLRLVERCRLRILYVAETARGVLRVWYAGTRQRMGAGHTRLLWKWRLRRDYRAVDRLGRRAERVVRSRR